MPEKMIKTICIRCPRGCEVTTSVDGYGAITAIHGNFCKLGEDHVRDELKDPRRTVTSTVRVKNGKNPLVPVWTDQPIPKDKILALAGELRKIELHAPVHIGQVVLQNALGTGSDVVASGDVEVK
jgi:CxxC motif-containing protein